MRLLRKPQPCLQVVPPHSKSGTSGVHVLQNIPPSAGRGKSVIFPLPTASKSADFFAETIAGDGCDDSDDDFSVAPGLFFIVTTVTIVTQPFI